ncbi:MAG: PD-(D/E)XK nuclease family protein [Anaeroplasmataceae bacterium]|nr:PD-(D/E)XK nuclease family protein [Anaeroplasmataceae bacterium]
MNLNEGFIICDTSMKEKILREVTTIKNYIFLTLEELKEKLTFRLKPKTALCLMQQFGFSYSLALEYCHAITKIEDKDYGIPKFDQIVSVLRYCKKEDLIETDPLFMYRLKQFPVTFLQPNASIEYERIKAMVSAITSVYEVNPYEQSFTPTVYEFPVILDEVLFVMNQIKNLLRKGINLNHIYLVHTDETYELLLKRLSKSYGIPIQFRSYKNICSSVLIQNFLKECKTKNSFDEVLASLDCNHPLYKKIVDCLNNLGISKELPTNCISFLKEEFKKITYPQKLLKDAIHLANEGVIFDENDYVFYLGFNLGVSPQLVREEGFLNNADLEYLQYSTSEDKNQMAVENLKRWILHTPNLILTYKKQCKTESFFPSLLIEELHLNCVKQEEISYGYSKVEDELRLVGLYDLFVKYGQWHKDLEKYGIQQAQYKAYKHQYEKLPLDIMQKHFEQKPLRLAYSNVKLYFACPFSYFADRILGLNEFKPQMAARLGTFSHAVLEDSYQPEFDFAASVKQHEEENALDGKDRFFFNQMTDVLRNLLVFNQQHESMSQLKQIEREAHIEVVKDSFVFEGFIDKLMYIVKNNEVYAAIVDYKTGADIVSLDNIEDGFHLQLPSYMYLLSHYEAFQGKKLHIIGIYLQKVNIVIFDNKTDIETQMAKKFMLEGYSVANPGLLSMLDPTYEKSTYIKSLGLGKDGFLRYSKIYLEEDQERIITMVENLLDTASKGILQGDFPIEPKLIRGKNESCMFCKYKDIWYSQYEDLKELEYKPFGKAGD